MSDTGYHQFSLFRMEQVGENHLDHPQKCCFNEVSREVKREEREAKSLNPQRVGRAQWDVWEEGMDRV